MLNASAASAVLGASDLERAKAFYTDKLGWQQVDQDDGGVFFSVAGTQIYLYATQFAGTNRATALMLQVEDLAAEVAALRAVGVEFADYDLPEITTVDGIATLGNEKAAWF